MDWKQLKGSSEGKLTCSRDIQWFNITIQVYIPVLVGHVPKEFMWALSAFNDFQHIARQQIFDKDSLDSLDDALKWFHTHCEIFQKFGVHSHFNLP